MYQILPKDKPSSTEMGRIGVFSVPAARIGAVLHGHGTVAVFGETPARADV
jgi:hypothetical protein